MGIFTDTAVKQGVIKAPVSSNSSGSSSGGLFKDTLAKQSIPKPDNSLAGRLSADKSYGSQVGAEQVKGVQKIGSSISKGASDINAGLNKGGIGGFGTTLKGLAEGAFGTIAGAGQAVLAPITPLVSKIASAITPALRQQNPMLAKAYDAVAPKIAEWSKAHPDASTLTSDVINTLLMAVGGGESKVLEAPLKEALTKDSLSNAGKDIIATGKTITDKLAPTSPETLNPYIDKQYNKAITPSSKSKLSLTASQTESNRETVKVISDNTDNLKYTSSNGTVYDSGRAPRTIEEHGQALIQTMQDTWNKMSSALKEKNVSISLAKPLEQIQAKMKELTSSSSEYPYLEALYNKYAKNPMVTSDQMNNFIKDLNNDAKPFFESGNDKAKASTSASVGNLFRTALDTTAQQIGTPEVSLLRKQYGALASSEKDVSRAIAKQLKGSSPGGVSGLADLFSGEEIARGVITGNPASIVSGVALQGTKSFLKWLRNPNRAISNLYDTVGKVTTEASTTGTKIPRMESSFAPKEKAGLPMIQDKVNPVSTPKVINLPGKIGGFDESQAKNIGIRTTPPNPVKVLEAPKGNFLNIGMNVGTTSEKLTEVQMKAKFTASLPKDVKITGYKIVKDPAEDTFVPTLSRPLTDTEMAKVLKATDQKAIPQLSNGVGTMHGTQEWGDFNKDYFKGVDWTKTSHADYAKSQGYSPATPTDKLPTIQLKGKLKP